MKPQLQPKLVSLGIHQGEAVSAAAGRYYTLAEALKECVQNCLDNDATRVAITVNYSDNSARVLGNGEGTSPEKFADALDNVFHSIKRNESGRRKFGRFGIGLFAPLDKCERYEFTAFDSTVSATHTWVMIQNDIKGSKVVQIPQYETEALPDGFTTCSMFFNLIRDKARTTCDINRLAQDIRAEFSMVIQEQSVVIHICIIDEKGVETTETVSSSEEFRGEPLELASYGSSDHSRADFEMYLAPLDAGKRSGQVLAGIEDDLFRLPLKSVLANTASGEVPSDFLKALDAGVFSGVIISTGCQLNDSRRNWRRNDALSSFCRYVSEWWKHVGSNLYEEIRQQNEESRYQTLGEQAMRGLLRTLSSPDLTRYREAMGKIEIGSVGSEHTEVNPSLVLGRQDVPSVEVSPESKGKGSNPSKDPNKEKKHTPLTVTGTRGQRRQTVRDNSLGLQITFSEMTGYSRMYHFDVRTGTIELNIRHPHWESLEGSDVALVEYQTMLVFYALASLVCERFSSEEFYTTSVEPIMDLWVAHKKLSI